MSRYFSRSEYERRWQKVEALMAERGFETAVVFSRGGGTTDNCGDVLYLANHYSVSGGTDSTIWSARSFSAVILRRGQEPELHIDEPEGRADLLAMDRVACHNHPFIGVAEALVARGVTGRVALCGTQFIPVKYYQQLVSRTPEIEWVEADDLIRSLRRIKSAEEARLLPDRRRGRDRGHHGADAGPPVGPVRARGGRRGRPRDRGARRAGAGDRHQSRRHDAV